VVAQGELYWVDFGEPIGSEPGFVRPAVVVQNDASNEQNMGTVIVCPVTSNVRRPFPGAVILDAGEGGLRVRSAVEVWSPTTLSSRAVDEFIGQLPLRRSVQIVSGMFRYLDPSQ
jgi:mRNA interferase MazF